MYDEHPAPMHCGPNDGGVKRGDRADTGDLEARPSPRAGRSGSGLRAGSGNVTGDASALTEGPGVSQPAETGDLRDEALTDGFSVHDAADPELGMTNIGGVPPEDWAADTGPAENPKPVANAAMPVEEPDRMDQESPEPSSEEAPPSLRRRGGR